MKRISAIIMAFVLIISFCAFAEADSWTCPQCEVVNTSAFCPNCGTQKPMETRAAFTFEGEGFASPREAAVAYVNAMNAGDAMGAIATFAIESAVDHIDSEAIIRSSRMAHRFSGDTIPVAGPFSRGLLIAKRNNDISSRLFDMYLYYSTIRSDYGRLGEGSYVSIGDHQAAVNFADHMRSASIENFVGRVEVIGAYLPGDEAVRSIVPEVYTSEPNMANLDRKKNEYGADDLLEVIVKLTISGEPYVQCMQCVSYNGKWYNYAAGNSVISMILGIDPRLNGLTAEAELHG